MTELDDLRIFIEKELVLEDHRGPLEPGDDLLATGVIDSLAIVKLTRFMEERYGIVVEDEDIVPDNFRSIEALARFIRTRRSG